jgi:hypothetical protein
LAVVAAAAAIAVMESLSGVGNINDDVKQCNVLIEMLLLIE